MSQTAPSSDNSGKRTSSPLAPPDERFWQRYSPHAEFPLSGAGSLVLHILVFGLLGLTAWLGLVLFNHANRSLPVEAVRLSGGGGNPQGQGDAPNTSAPVEAADQPNDAAPAENVPAEDVPNPKIEVKSNPQLKQPQFDDPTARPIRQADDASNVFASLRKRASRIHDSSKPSADSGYGKGGTGEGGGSGDGKGPGVGKGNGQGASNLTQREKRMVRWSMLFNTTNSADYVAQLRGLRAILAVPVKEGPSGPEYQIIRDLSARKPAKLLKEDIREIQRMVYWVDEKSESVQGVMSVLRVKLKPSHFLAFMPEELEKKLLNLEIAYLHKHHPKRTEDDIEGTKFVIKVRGGKYEPEVREQKVK